MLDTQSVIKNGMVINHIQKATWIPHFYWAPHYMVKRVIEIDFILFFAINLCLIHGKESSKSI